MSFPVVGDTNTSSETTNVSSHDVSLPANIVAGDLLVVIFGVDGDPAITWPGAAGDWNVFGTVTYSAAGRSKMELAWREADETEGATIVVTTDVTERSAHNSYRITGAKDPDTQAPEMSTGATTPSNSTSADHDSLTPAGGATSFLWLAVGVTDNGNGVANATTAPTNYTDLLNINSGATAGVGAFSSRRNLNASSEDPGATTIDTANRWIAATVAVHPDVYPPWPRQQTPMTYRL